MADDTTINSGLLGLDPSYTTTSNNTREVDNNEEVNKEEFLQLLVTQLKQQDPLNPMENEEFAVQLAQFSQLEQLIAINDSLGSKGGGQTESLSAYLGNEVTLGNSEIHVSGHDGGKVSFQLADDATDVRVELLNQDDSVREVVELGPLSAGQHSIALSNLESESGIYQSRVVAQNPSGEQEIAAAAAGIVSGFIPGPEPVLLMGNREIALGDVTKVSVPQ